MAIADATEKNFKAAIREGVVLLDFRAAWCDPWPGFGPVFAAAARACTFHVSGVTLSGG